MSKGCIYGFGTTVNAGFEETLLIVEQLLARHGFLVHTRLNVEDLLAGVRHDRFGHYLILGACNPALAKELFNADPDIGLLVPCNVIVYELPTGGCRVMIKDPLRIMDFMEEPRAIQAAMEVKEQMEQIVEELSRHSFREERPSPHAD